MNDLRGYRDSDLLAMLEQMEQMQAELTEKTQTIQALESELQQLPTLSEWHIFFPAAGFAILLR